LFFIQQANNIAISPLVSVQVAVAKEGRDNQFIILNPHACIQSSTQFGTTTLFLQDNL